MVRLQRESVDKEGEEVKSWISTRRRRKRRQKEEKQMSFLQKHGLES
jgi:hypothetical protein